MQNHFFGNAHLIDQALIAGGVCLVILLYTLWHHYHWNRHPLLSMRSWKPKKGLLLLQKISLALAVGLLILSSLRPQWGIRQELLEQSGIDLVFVVDVSNSMKAIDFSTQNQMIDRLAVAKQTLHEFVQARTSDRLGLVTFAGEAFIASPLTFDHDVFLTFLEAVSPRDIHIQGTNLTEALRVSLQRLQGSITTEEERSRALVLVSDGEETIPAEAAALAKAAGKIGIPIFTIGIGSLEGVPIPEAIDIFGNLQYKQFRGQTVLTHLNEQTLKTIAELSGGSYFHAGHREDLPKLIAHLEELPKTILNQKSQDTHTQHYQIFTGIALLCFLLFLWQPQKKSKNKIFLLIFMPIFLTGCSNELLFKHQLKNANAAAQENPEMAIHLYDQARNHFPKLGSITQNNKIRLAYENEQYHEARLAWGKVIQEYCDLESGAPIDRYCGDFFYNLGNSLYRISEEFPKKAQRDPLLEEAALQYESALEINPRDKLAWENLAFIRELLNQEPPPPMPGPGDGEGEGEGESESESESESDSESEGEGQGQGQGESESDSDSDSESESEQNKEESNQENQENQADQGSDKENQEQQQPGQGESEQEQNSENQEPGEGEGEGKGESESESKSDQENQQNQENQGSDKENQEQKDQGEKGEGEGESESEQKKDQPGEGEGESESESEGESDSNAEPLPQDIQDYIDQLEQAQKDNQDNFNRNPQPRSARSPYAQPRMNPLMQDFMDDLSNDPFFQQFFFGGPQGDPSGEKQYQQDLPKQFEKDW